MLTIDIIVKLIIGLKVTRDDVCALDTRNEAYGKSQRQSAFEMTGDRVGL